MAAPALKGAFMAGAAGCLCAAVILLLPTPAFAWGPVTHIALGLQVLATVITPDHPLQEALLGLPELFLYGSLAPDIVQGRRLQSRLRRHSHNWSTATAMLEAARDEAERTLAFGYLAHLGADVVAHNFFLPACLIDRYRSRLSGHIYSEARVDTSLSSEYRNLLVKLLALDFRPMDAMLSRALDTPLVGFSAHRRVFEGGLKRVRGWDRIIKALGGGGTDAGVHEQQLFLQASVRAVAAILRDPHRAPVSRFDPMGAQAVRSAMESRRNLQRLNRLSPTARMTARQMASRMVADLDEHLRQMPFGAPAP